jgi:hypothetical protein
MRHIGDRRRRQLLPQIPYSRRYRCNELFLVHRLLHRTYLRIPHGREARLAGWDARREEQNVVIPAERRATRQTARQGASRTGFNALARTILLRALRMRFGHSTRRASRIRTNASETRLMGNPEIGSNRRRQGVP